MRAYDQLFDALYLQGNAADLGISYDDFGAGYCIFVWDLSRSGCSSSLEHFDKPLEGDLSIEVSLKSTNKTISLIMCSEFTQRIEIDRYHSVKVFDM
jgi:hypothetical protein